MFQIAQVLKSNGTDGELVLSFRTVDPDDVNLTEPVFINFDGLPVPFFIESLTKRGSSKALVHLTDISSNKDALEVVGQPVWAREEDYEELAPEEEDFSYLVGWALEGVGEIVDFIDIPSNPCIEVSYKDSTVVVPLHEDLITKVVEKKRILAMELPDGLLDL
ncbi:MAG: hypothetical protein MJY56_02560 [Bacteroidales bacterium]|nr:hypothetical protein [Bacteroidales bacterium]